MGDGHRHSRKELFSSVSSSSGVVSAVLGGSGRMTQGGAVAGAVGGQEGETPFRAAGDLQVSPVFLHLSGLCDALLLGEAPLGPEGRGDDDDILPTRGLGAGQVSHPARPWQAHAVRGRLKGPRSHGQPFQRRA